MRRMQRIAPQHGLRGLEFYRFHSDNLVGRGTPYVSERQCFPPIQPSHREFLIQLTNLHDLMLNYTPLRTLIHFLRIPLAFA